LDFDIHRFGKVLLPRHSSDELAIPELLKIDRGSGRMKEGANSINCTFPRTAALLSEMAPIDSGRN
jgi:hypothetical protein